MIYLILAMVCSMLIAVLMRMSEKHCGGSMSMLAVNYAACLLMGVAFTGVGEVFPAAEGLPFAMGLGIVCGALYLGGFLLMQWNTARNGVVLSATFMRLGVMVPTMLSMLIFGETPRATQLIGLAGAVCAIFLMNGKGDRTAGSIVSLVVMMLTGGTSDFMSKVYEQMGNPALSNHFLLYIFAAALVMCAALCIVRRQRLTGKDVLFGLIIGVPNYLSAKFLLQALEQVPAVIVYPTYSVGTILLVAVVGMLCFRERLNQRKSVAMGVILAALVLLNV